MSERMKNMENQKRLLERYFPENLVDFLVEERKVPSFQAKMWKPQ